MDLRKVSETLWLSCGSLLRSLTQQNIEGRPLEQRPSGDLSECRKLYFDESHQDPRPGWRIVFRFRPNDRNRVQVQIIAIGRRKDSAVYKTAVKRLLN